MSAEERDRFVWDWSTEDDTYLVRYGDAVICRTDRTAKGYERAKLIVDLMNAAEAERKTPPEPDPKAGPEGRDG